MRKKLSAISFLVVVSALVGCQTRLVRRGQSPVPAAKEQILQGTATPPPSPANPTIWQKSSSAKVALVLGPGGAKTFAHVGVLKSLVQNHVPVAKVVGLEWASLIGALYSVKGQVHEVEWKLYKMEHKDWLPKKGLFTSQTSGANMNSMNDFFKDAFSGEDLSQFKIPFACPSRSLWTATTVMQARGSVRDAMRKCMPFPPLFQVQGSFIAAPSSARQVIQELRNQGYNVIILVDVLGSALPVPPEALMDFSTHVILWQEMRRELLEARAFATDVIEVDTGAYPMVKFTARKELVELGESASRAPVTNLVNKYGF